MNLRAVVSHIWMSHITHEWFMSHINWKNQFIPWTNHGTNMNERALYQQDTETRHYTGLQGKAGNVVNPCCVCVYLYVCVSVCVFVCACVCACVRACVRACVHACVRAYVRAYVRACVRACKIPKPWTLQLQQTDLSTRINQRFDVEGIMTLIRSVAIFEELVQQVCGVCVHVYLYACACVCLCGRLCGCVYVYIHLYTYIHIEKIAGGCFVALVRWRRLSVWI